MKGIKYWILILLLLILAGCSNQHTKKEEELKAAVKAVKEEFSTQKEIKQDKGNKKEKIRDIAAVIDFVNESDANTMVNRKEENLKILENYEEHYFDFTGEGNDDVAIVTWDEENEYLPVIFVTTDVLENEYYLINSDFRGNPGDAFFCDGSFIIKNDKKNKLYDIAYNHENQYINMSTRYIGYGDMEQILNPKIDNKCLVDYELEKIDGFKQLNIHITYIYLDENGKNHKYKDITQTYTFDKEKKEHNVVETHNMESIPLDKLISENLIIGTDNSLKSFETIYKENDLKVAVNYYYENRTKFSKRARIQYVEEYEEFINSIFTGVQDEMVVKDEIISAGVISSVAVQMNLLPQRVSSVFSIVKHFFVQDASYPTDRILQEGIYTIACINKDVAGKINLMQYDKEVLVEGEHTYGIRGDRYVDTEFQTQVQMIEEIKDIVYPTVLIDNLNQIDEVKYKDIWKANIVIVPEKINFY